MQHFQSILIFIGLLAIGGVLIHGYFINRKEKAALLEKKTAIDASHQKDDDHFINDGVIDDLEFSHPREEYEQDNIDFSKALDDQDDETINFSEQHDFDKQDSVKIKLSSSDRDESSAEFHADSEKIDNSETDSVDKRQSITHTKNKAMSEPLNKAPEDVFIFNVVAKEGAQVRGSEILQFFITSGFRFGENAIFHRHLHSDGTGPILFSIANMMEPGIFDLDSMEQFVSEGISFFVVAPNPEINVKEAFDLMLTAVQQMTDEFECVVLNAQREPFTEQQFRDDHERLMRYA